MLYEHLLPSGAAACSALKEVSVSLRRVMRVGKQIVIWDGLREILEYLDESKKLSPAVLRAVSMLEYICKRSVYTSNPLIFSTINHPQIPRYNPQIPR